MGGTAEVSDAAGTALAGKLRSVMFPDGVTPTLMVRGACAVSNHEANIVPISSFETRPLPPLRSGRNQVK